ncbi:hypothetical protein OOZ15_10275 [Galbibacter sp. EGI 63066]|uniref:hypothetical protein n=1 Tax=Galbibacter sp. EGI 63066 TaxID=2993559 RepID=UPI00224950BC|nr:hypothetical protein [Galbibacter sp. EGI 63066]MCX2680326.1 hypothetical protein [Galbibacter sp. EGI 63066]
MATLPENTTSVIKLTDPDLPQFLDFKKLRKEGLEHIGNLSGKIWTDHNVHDPGITILEVLVYALMDLGYKTNLPFEDLIAQEDTQTEDDNFLTPLEILTINPVTVTDYRKLLLEIKGVRNAWLIPAEQEKLLYINPENNTLSCQDTQGVIYDCNDRHEVLDDKFKQIHLNGLYNIYIEKENEVEDNDTLIQEVKELLSAYRNLCEDVANITVLKPVDFGVCAEVEMHSGYNAETVYKKIIIAIKNFIQPQINYYTLNELLEKGKAIDDIFAGRPYRTESFGFVDTEELENLKKRKFIHLSDLYNVILTIEGVRKIKKIHIKGGKIINDPSPKWVESNMLCDDEVPVFSLENTCIDLYSAQGLLNIDKPKVHKTFSFAKKFELPLKDLDSQIPSGRYREDLGDYYSIQNDFPVVYGVGDEGLPDSATLLRKTQALQLKGYLMFYDQILANYTSQLTHIRSLFSLKPEEERSAEEKQTYLTQLPESIPGIEKLLKFYDQSTNITEGTELALPVSNNLEWKTALDKLRNNPRTALTIGNYCDDKNGLVSLFTFTSANIRSIYINQIIDSFFDENYTIEIFSDRYGYFFVLHPFIPNDLLLVGTKRYTSESEARNEAKSVAFLASMQENYKLVTEKSESDTLPDSHYFGLNYHPISYMGLIKELTENKDEYITRRKQFLDHLLARFGEDFTDYTLLQYQQKISKEEQDKITINDQSSYLNQFAEISRNRGKAFDYLQPSWNTDNVSGFEKRISLLSGIENYNRRNLCNFEVTPCFRLLLKDEKGSVLFRSNRSYETKVELDNASAKVLAQLRDPKTYKQLEKNLNGFDATSMNRIFSTVADDENTIVKKYHYSQKLFNNKDEEIAISKNKKMTSAKTANDKKDDFIKNINKQDLKSAEKDKTYELIPIEKKDHYLDVNALDLKISTLKSWKWHVINAESAEKESSDNIFETNSDEAWDNLVEEKKYGNYLIEHDEALRWKLKVNDYITFTALNFYPDAYKAVAAWRQAKTLGSSTKNYDVVEKEKGVYVIYLKGEKGNNIAVSGEIDSSQFNSDKAIDEFVSVFTNRNTQPDYDKERDKFGFNIPVNKTEFLVSYIAFNTEKDALQEIEKIYELGKTKKNYLLSGDEGNPEYNFILRDKDDSFIALPSNHFETAADRNKALNAIIRFFKKSELPVFVKEEPRRYVWSLYDSDGKMIRSSDEFSSKRKAKLDFNEYAVKEHSKSYKNLFAPHIYEFKVGSTPALYCFLYGITNAHNKFEPLFISNKTFKKPEEASQAYTDFANKLSALSLKKTRGKNKKYDFALYESSKMEPIAVQYKSGREKASIEAAETSTNYIKSIYTKSGQARKSFVANEMAESQEGRYQWRFYKKNNPLVRSPYCCESESLAKRIKSIICGIIPPIDLKECPPKPIVVCPKKDSKKDSKKYHYQICFGDKEKKEKNEFVLISYVGYNTHQEAVDAWKKELLDVIDLARNPKQYEENGKISTDEVYKDPNSKACDDASFIAVIPERIKQKVEGTRSDLVEYYTKLADIFPIYKIEEDDVVKYKYRVVVPEEGLISIDCEYKGGEHLGSLIWTSIDCFESYEEAVKAYQHFYALAGTSNNCRIFCERGCYYVGLIEVLAESFCEYNSEDEAWDAAFPEAKDSCNNCLPGGVREFVYAAEDDKNFIPVCDQNYWKFKVVSPAYFVADHKCYYNSGFERDKNMEKWVDALEQLNWSDYTYFNQGSNETINAVESGFMARMTNLPSERYQLGDICDIVHTIRECLKGCSKGAEDQESHQAKLINCLKEKIKNEAFLNAMNDLDITALYRIADYFPVYKTEKGYCYRLYWPQNDRVITENGLQPCGCDGTVVEDSDSPCNEPYPFVSSNCYNCCSEALDAFMKFCELIKSGSYALECTSVSEYGPYSFRIVDKSKELAYHPQQYDSLQEVKDAIKITKSCVNDVGMHLLEHILLRPKTDRECRGDIIIDADGNRTSFDCLLPICPDYCCDIEWQKDTENEDSCAEENSNIIHYLPGSDPYSFWATVVLPSWAKRFRTEESRQAFEKLLYKEVPALVGLNILWLSPRDMCRFEEGYRKWLQWMQDPNNICDFDDLKCVLARLIKNLKSEAVCPSPPGQQGNCNCEEEDQRDIDPCCLPPDAKGTLFWGYCPPENIPVDDPGPFVTTHVSSVRSEATEVKAIEDDGKATLTMVRKRKPAYLSNIVEVADERMLKTKSYERTHFFLENIPTIDSYVQLVNFFKRYSLQKDNKLESFFELIKNATWHLLDKLVLERKTSLKKTEISKLKSSLKTLEEKGISLKQINKEWKSEDLKSLANKKPLNQLKKILK